MRQFLPAFQNSFFINSQLNPGFLIVSLVFGQFQVTDISCRLHPHGQFKSIFSGDRLLLLIIPGGIRINRCIICSADFRCHLENSIGHVQLFLFELDGGQLFTGRQHQETQKILSDSKLQIGGTVTPIRKAGLAEKSGILEQTGFHDICLGNAQVFISSLQIRIVQQSDLDSTIDCQF